MINNRTNELCAGFRMNWMRYQSCSSLSILAASISDHQTLVKSMSLLLSYTSWIDAFDINLEKFSSLKLLYFHRPSLIEHLKDSIEKRAEQSSYICAFAEVARYMPFL